MPLNKESPITKTLCCFFFGGSGCNAVLCPALIPMLSTSANLDTLCSVASQVLTTVQTFNLIFFPPEKGVAYNDYPSIFLVGGSLEVWS